MSSCIPFTQSWHSLPPWKTVIAAGQVKQIWFHSYLVTLRFSFSWAGCNKIRLVPPGLGRNLLPSRLEMDGENPDWLWLAAGLWGAGSSAVYWRGKEGWMDRGEGHGRQNREKSISRPSESSLWYELVQIFPFSLSHKGMVHSTPITETPRKRDVWRQILQKILGGWKIQSYSP